MLFIETSVAYCCQLIRKAVNSNAPFCDTVHRNLPINRDVGLFVSIDLSFDDIFYIFAFSVSIAALILLFSYEHQNIMKFNSRTNGLDFGKKVKDQGLDMSTYNPRII